MIESVSKPPFDLEVAVFIGTIVVFVAGVLIYKGFSKGAGDAVNNRK